MCVCVCVCVCVCECVCVFGVSICSKDRVLVIISNLYIDLILIC